MEKQMKKLYKSRKNRVFAGIIGGLGEYFNVDPTVLRVIFVLMIFASFSLLFWSYIVMIFIVPEEPENRYSGKEKVGGENEAGIER